MLKDRVAIITGATRGIGRAVTDGFANYGAKIVLVARNAAEIEEVVSQLKNKNVECIGIKADVTEKAEVKNVVEKT